MSDQDTSGQDQAGQDQANADAANVPDADTTVGQDRADAYVIAMDVPDARVQANGEAVIPDAMVNAFVAKVLTLDPSQFGNPLYIEGVTTATRKTVTNKGYALKVRVQRKIDADGTWSARATHRISASRKTVNGVLHYAVKVTDKADADA